MIAYSDKKNLEKGVLFAYKAISPRTPLAILSNFRIEACNDKIKISATDLEFGIEVSVDAEVYEGGSFTVPAKTFSEVISLIDNDIIELHKPEDDCELKIISGSNKCSLMTLHSDEFPMIPKSDDQPVFTILQKDLKDAIKYTAKSAASQEETRAVLTGIFLKLSDSLSTFVATDSKRLSIAKVKVNYHEDEEKSYIIPEKVLSEISKFLKDSDEEVSVGIKNSQIFFRIGENFVISRLLEGVYPKAEQVLPESLTHEIKFSRTELISSIKFILALAKEKSFPNLVKFEFSKNKLSLKTNTSDLGSAMKDIECEYDGEDMDISFNGQYFIDPLDAISSDTVYFRFTDKASPAVIDENTGERTYVIMPIVL